MKGEDGKPAVAAILRAIEADLIVRTGVNVRGTSMEGALGELLDAGVSEEVARRALALLSACEDARFAPTALTITAAKELWAEAKDVLREVGDHGGDRSSTPPASARPSSRPSKDLS